MIYYLYHNEQSEFVFKLKELEQAKDIEFVEYANDSDLDLLDLATASHLITTGSMQEIKKIIHLALRYNLSLGIVPLPSQSRLIKMFDLSKKIDESFAVATTPSEHSIDLFYCNDIIVLNDVRVGNVTVLKEFEYDYLSESIWVRAKYFWDSWRKKEPIKHYQFRVKTSKDDEKIFSAVGLIGIDYDNGSWISSILRPYLGLSDGQHILAVLAPMSLFQFFISHPLSLVFNGNQRGKLPASLGYIKSSEILIACDGSPDIVIDDKESAQIPIRLKTEESVLRLSAGEKFWQKDSGSGKSDRDSIKLDNIPKDEESMEYLSRGIPTFEHASQERYTALFASLRQDAALSSIFMTLLILATMIATFGLFINSSSVIIGAMLLAPLMQPIVSLSMGVLRQDSSLQSKAIKTIIAGVLAVVFTAALISFIIPIERLTDEMASRLSPTLLDLFVAIVSGIAAAYVKNNEKILSSLAGVAIAVALVPPLAVAGIGLGWAQWSMFGSAFLLFTTNLVGIVLSSAMTFMVLGYSPIRIAGKGIAIWFMIVVLVAVPLYSSFGYMQESARISNILTNRYFMINGKKLELAHIEILRHKRRPHIRCEVISSGVLTNTDKAYLKKEITRSIGQDMEIIATFRYRL